MLFLVNSVCARDLCLAKQCQVRFNLRFLSVPLGRSTVFYYLRIKFSMQLQFSFFRLCSYSFDFSELFIYAATVFFLPELILHKYSVEGYGFLEDAFCTDSVFNTSWFDSGCMSRQFTEAGLDCPNCGFSAVADVFFGRRHPLRFAVADFHGPDCSACHRDSTVAVRIWWSMSLLCRRGEVIRAPTVAAR